MTIEFKQEGKFQNFRVWVGRLCFGTVGQMANGRWAATSGSTDIGAKLLEEASKTKGYESRELAAERLIHFSNGGK